MKRFAIITLLGLALVSIQTPSAQAIWPGSHHANRADRLARYYASQRPWHGPYAYTQWGTPVALVVPPTAKMHTAWSWGVSMGEMTPIYHQFHRDYPGGMYGPIEPPLPTPHWPSHTDQLGVYPVRGPW